MYVFMKLLYDILNVSVIIITFCHVDWDYFMKKMSSDLYQMPNVLDTYSVLSPWFSPSPCCWL